MVFDIIFMVQHYVLYPSHATKLKVKSFIELQEIDYVGH